MAGTAHALSAVSTPSAPRRQVVTARWLTMAIVIALAALVAGALWLRTSQASTASQDATVAVTQRDATAQQATSLADSIGAACRDGAIPTQYRRACVQAEQVKADPVPGPPGPPGVSIPGSAGATGAAGAAGATGSVGPSGAAGQAGTQGNPGAVGPPGPAGTNGVDGATGPAGPAGPRGDQGPPGKDGADSTIPGPQGPAGHAGADGQPPAGWTFTDTLGQTHTCSRDTASPESAPRYSCD